MLSLLSALKVPSLHTIRILDSSESPLIRVPVFGDYLKICGYKGIKVVYEYDTSLSVSQARYHLLDQVETEFVLFLDSDVILDSVPPLVHAPYAFACPSVINVGEVRYLPSEDKIWLKQFKEHTINVPVPFAGMFGLVFHKDKLTHSDWEYFRNYVKDIWPYEDALLSRYLSIINDQPGVIKKHYRAFHIGKTRKELWNYTLARQIEDNIAQCNNLTNLLEVAAQLKAT